MTKRILRPGLRGFSRLVSLAGATAMLAPQAVCASPQDCELLQSALTQRQAAKYSLTLAGCPGLQIAADPPARESRQLQLYGGRVAQSSLILEDAHPRAPLVQPSPRPAPPVAAPKSQLRALQLAPDVDTIARQYDIDPLLLHAIAYVESRHDPKAVSKAGAMGVMQVMPGTAGRFGVSDARALHDARTNLEVSANYLKTLQQRFGNDLSLVLAAYNAGEGAVERHGRRVPPFRETRRYVHDVLERYAALTAARRQAAEEQNKPASKG
ncbi:MAG TPA: lytic transglycosylase domain-containing protein [Burkholderiaceae bacterium]|nr:lytic transglycosylase domain-containing protein [Burkholderiaceae bacterium]